MKIVRRLTKIIIFSLGILLATSAMSEGMQEVLRQKGVVADLFITVQLNRSDAQPAFIKLESLAKSGNVYAQAGLGSLYESGYGKLKRSSIKAAFWYRKAAEQGNVQSQYDLGSLYREGEGLPKDYSQALNWYRKAANQGNVDAELKLGTMYWQGEGITKDYTIAFDWFQKAAEHGAINAQYVVALAFGNGLGTQIDYLQALKWGTIANANGNEEAGNWLKAMETAHPTQIKSAQKLASEWWATQHPNK
ncbi:tetratricopeptide repeat protein [Glaciimonas sp. GNP009]